MADDHKWREEKKQAIDVDALYAEMARVAKTRLKEGEQTLSVPESYEKSADAKISINVMGISGSYRAVVSFFESILKNKKKPLLERETEEKISLFCKKLKAQIAEIKKGESQKEPNEIKDMVQYRLGRIGLVKMISEQYKENEAELAELITLVLNQLPEETQQDIKEIFRRYCLNEGRTPESKDGSIINFDDSFAEILARVRKAYQPKVGAISGAARFQAYDTGESDFKKVFNRKQQPLMVEELLFNVIGLNGEALNLKTYLAQMCSAGSHFENPQEQGEELAFAAFLTQEQLINLAKVPACRDALQDKQIAARFYSALPSHSEFQNKLIQQQVSLENNVLNERWEEYERDRFILSDTERLRQIVTIIDLVEGYCFEGSSNVEMVSYLKNLLSKFQQEREFVEKTLPLLPVHPAIYKIMRGEKGLLATDGTKLQEALNAEEVDSSLVVQLSLNEMARFFSLRQKERDKHIAPLVGNLVTHKEVLLEQDVYRHQFLTLVNSGDFGDINKIEGLKALVQAARIKQGEAYFAQYCREDEDKKADDARKFRNEKEVYFSTDGESAVVITKEGFIFQYLMDRLLGKEPVTAEIKKLLAHPKLLHAFCKVLFVGSDDFSDRFPDRDAEKTWRTFLLNAPHSEDKKALITSFIEQELNNIARIGPKTIKTLRFAIKAKVKPEVITKVITKFIEQHLDQINSVDQLTVDFLEEFRDAYSLDENEEKEEKSADYVAKKAVLDSINTVLDRSIKAYFSRAATRLLRISPKEMSEMVGSLVLLAPYTTHPNKLHSATAQYSRQLAVAETPPTLESLITMTVGSFALLAPFTTSPRQTSISFIEGWLKYLVTAETPLTLQSLILLQSELRNHGLEQYFQIAIQNHLANTSQITPSTEKLLMEFVMGENEYLEKFVGESIFDKFIGELLLGDHLGQGDFQEITPSTMELLALAFTRAGGVIAAGEFDDRMHSNAKKTQKRIGEFIIRYLEKSAMAQLDSCRSYADIQAFLSILPNMTSVLKSLLESLPNDPSEKLSERLPEALTHLQALQESAEEKSRQLVAEDQVEAVKEIAERNRHIAANKLMVLMTDINKSEIAYRNAKRQSEAEAEAVRANTLKKLIKDTRRTKIAGFLLVFPGVSISALIIFISQNIGVFKGMFDLVLAAFKGGPALVGTSLVTTVAMLWVVAFLIILGGFWLIKKGLDVGDLKRILIGTLMFISGMAIAGLGAFSFIGVLPLSGIPLIVATATIGLGALLSLVVGVWMNSTAKSNLALSEESVALIRSDASNALLIAYEQSIKDFMKFAASPDGLLAIQRDPNARKKLEAIRSAQVAELQAEVERTGENEVEGEAEAKDEDEAKKEWALEEWIQQLLERGASGDPASLICELEKFAVAKTSINHMDRDSLLEKIGASVANFRLKTIDKLLRDSCDPSVIVGILTHLDTKPPKESSLKQMVQTLALHRVPAIAHHSALMIAALSEIVDSEVAKKLVIAELAVFEREKKEEKGEKYEIQQRDIASLQLSAQLSAVGLEGEEIDPQQAVKRLYERQVDLGTIVKILRDVIGVGATAIVLAIHAELPDINREAISFALKEGNFDEQEIREAFDSLSDSKVDASFVGSAAPVQDQKFDDDGKPAPLAADPAFAEPTVQQPGDSSRLAELQASVQGTVMGKSRSLSVGGEASSAFNTADTLNRLKGSPLSVRDSENGAPTRRPLPAGKRAAIPVDRGAISSASERTLHEEDISNTKLERGLAEGGPPSKSRPRGMTR